DVRLPHRCGKAAEAAVYFAIAEGLTNAAKHSRASDARVTVRMREDETGRKYIWARVEDNGTGGAKVTPGGGLDGITNRVAAARVTVRMREDGTGREYSRARGEDNGTGGAKGPPGGCLDGIPNRVVAAGGNITVDSPLGGPTALEVSVPCAS